jgi:hypothetical protein
VTATAARIAVKNIIGFSEKSAWRLTRHAEAIGCRLIIDPFLSYDQWGEQARRVRLKCLRDFLEKMPDERCQVAIRPTLGHGTNFTYVGSWFAAETTTAVLGKDIFRRSSRGTPHPLPRALQILMENSKKLWTRWRHS